MTRYAFDSQNRKLIATWGTGAGDRAATIAELDSGVSDEHGLRLAQALTTLSGALWRAYTEPASAAGDSEEANSEAWHRAETRKAFATVPEAVENPNLPDEHGSLIVCYDPVKESAHRLGRVLYAITDGALSEVMRTDVAAELAAVENAECGDLRGRAQQAVLLSRPEASPSQVNAANRVLHKDPLGGSELFTELDPTAAAVAASHWLRAASEVAGEQAGIDPTRVVLEADAIEALPVETPTLVLERLAAGQSPYTVVVSLVRDAAIVAEGKIPDAEALTRRIKQLEDKAAAFGGNQDGLREALFAELRLTPLDPSRASLDLLEDLLTGIHACWLIYNENADYDYPEADEDSDDEGEDDYDERRGELMREFCEAVREKAEATRDELE
jgi:regulator of RNase E activity RraB